MTRLQKAGSDSDSGSNHGDLKNIGNIATQIGNFFSFAIVIPILIFLSICFIIPFFIGVGNIYLAMANDYPIIKKYSRFVYLNLCPPLTFGIYQIVHFFKLINFMQNKNNKTKKIKMMKRKYKKKSSSK